MSHSLFLLDKDGNAANAINGQPIFGEIAGWKGLSYTPAGAAIDTVPQNKVSIPLSDWRNLAVDTGAQIMVMDNDLAAEVTRGPILDINQSVDEHDVHWAEITFADALYELSRADVTSSFATSQGESLALTVIRLLSLADTVWTGLNDVTGLDGVAFTATGSIAQASDKLRQERFAHFRREMLGTNPRGFHLSVFGTAWTINGLPVWMVAPGVNPTMAAANLYERQMFTPQFNKRGEVINSYTPTGGGNGVSQLTLRTLYGVTNFTGYNAAYPVQQRINQGGSTSDGFDYFVEDAASIARYGRTRNPLARPSISAVVNSAGGVSVVDETAAAVSLYVTTRAQLALTAQPVLELSFTTPAVGDLRNCGGLTTHVQYAGYAFDPTNKAYQFLDVDDDYTILSAVRTVDDANGSAMDSLTVSSTGQAVASTGGTLLGVMDTVTAMHAGVQTAFYPVTKQKAQAIGPLAPLRLHLYADNSVVRQHYMLLYVTLEGTRQTRNDLGHTQDVVTAPTPHDVAAVGHDVNPLGINLYTSGNPVQNTANGNATFDPQPTLPVHKQSSKPASAKPVYFDGTTFFWDGTSDHTVDIDHATFVIETTVRTTDANGNPVGGTAGKLKPTTGAATGTGQIGGTVAKATHLASSGVGALKAVATIEQVYEGPLPTGVTIWVDNVQIAGPFNGSVPVIDLNPYTSGAGLQAGHVIEVRAATDGNADASIEGRRDVANVAVTPTS